MKIYLEEKDERMINEMRGNKDNNFLFKKSDEGRNLSIEFEITDYAMASIFVASFLSRNSDFLKCGIKPKQLSLIPHKEKMDKCYEYLQKALNELQDINEYLQ